MTLLLLQKAGEVAKYRMLNCVFLVFKCLGLIDTRGVVVLLGRPT